MADHTAKVKDIIEKKLNRIVVAACSPRLHEPTFRKCIAQAGLNPFMAEMANIREHCSWVHSDRSVATGKAFDLTRMAAARIRRNEPLVQTQIPITKKALVVGGGIAGIQAALDIAEALARQGQKIDRRLVPLRPTPPAQPRCRPSKP